MLYKFKPTERVKFASVSAVNKKVADTIGKREFTLDDIGLDRYIAHGKDGSRLTRMQYDFNGDEVEKYLMKVERAETPEEQEIQPGSPSFVEVYDWAFDHQLHTEPVEKVIAAYKMFVQESK